MPMAHVNKCNFYYEMAGEGDALVFVHGETHGTQLFEYQIPHYSRTRRCFTYDRRGHGRSQLAEYGYSLWNQTEDLRCLLEFAGIERAVIVAVAMGTPIAATFALQYPNRVDAIVMCSWYELDGFPALENRRKAYQMSFSEVHLKMRDIMLERGRRGLEDFLEENHKTALLIFPPDKPEIRRKLVKLFASHLPEHYVRSAEYYTSIPNMRARLHEVKCPILGICGTSDPSPDDPALLKDVPNFRQAWITGARRFTMMEYPEQFNAVLDQFLAELAPSRT
jgi:pimeloyl-ACP methyl ester carboxylesterase